MRIAKLLVTACWAFAAQAAGPQFTTIYDFGKISNGVLPPTGVIEFNGVLYGVTERGGASHCGTVFSLTPPATPGGRWQLSTLYTFPAGKAEAGPHGPLTVDVNGNLYGASGMRHGIIFELSPPAVASGEWTLSVLHRFHGGSDGESPDGGLLLDADGALYGGTAVGGIDNCPNYPGCGTVYKLSPPAAPGGHWRKHTLYSFAGGTDGNAPGNGLTRGPGGFLYGVTIAGGADTGGTVFQLTPPAAPGEGWTETVVHSFIKGAGPANRSGPYSALVVGKHGELFGTRPYGGDRGQGNVFELRPPVVPGGAWVEKVLCTFSRAIGDAAIVPYGGLTLGASGELYGTTNFGGTKAELGTIFELQPPAAPGGEWTKTILHEFTGGTDGEYPYYTTLVRSGGTLYGTTWEGGTTHCKNDACGTVFQIIP